MSLRRVLATGIAAWLSASALAAQTGGGSGGCSVGPGFACTQIHADSGNGRERQTWLRAIVLWRGAEGRREGGPFDSAAQAQGQARRRNAQRAAEDSGRIFLGGGTYDRSWSASYTGLVPSRRSVDTLFVGDQRFVLPRRDSALVVMVDEAGAETSPSRLVGTAWISAELDPAYWPKFWTSGDTSFTVMPRRESTILRDALERVPAVRAFLSRAPGRPH